MHLLVLSAFRPDVRWHDIRRGGESQCTFWCSVLSDLPLAMRVREVIMSQCTFWCSVLSDVENGLSWAYELEVSMHLLVLSAFRLNYDCVYSRHPEVSMHLLVLSAFRPNTIDGTVFTVRVSMHLLVLSAFRHSSTTCGTRSDGLNAPFGAQCFPTTYLLKWNTTLLCLNAPFGAQCFPTGLGCLLSLLGY